MLYYFTEPGTYTRCGKDFNNQKTGRFQSPNYPRNYPVEAHCTWKITAARGKYVRLTFDTIDIQGKYSNELIKEKQKHQQTEIKNTLSQYNAL